MSQQRMRKEAVVGRGNRSRPFAPAGKDSGDTVPSKIGNKLENQKSGNKNKIPKSIRYDLESALVNLCDLWFEDIKPHLIKNNIKLHVHGAGSGSASGDHGRVPPGALGCSHRDPGAASDQRRRSDARCVDCCSTLRTASKVQCPRPRTHRRLSPASPVPRRRPTSLQISLPHATSNNYRGCNGKTNPRPRRKNRVFQVPSSLPQPNWRVPRLCRTCSILPPTCNPSTQMACIDTDLQPQQGFVPRDGNSLRRRKHKVKIKHKSTQTESTLRHSESEATPMPPKSRGPSPETMSIPNTHKNSEANGHQSRSSAKPLFSQDLVNLIAEKHDKKLRTLYKSPQRKDCPSFMNLIQSSGDRLNNWVGVAKKKPWR